MRCNYAVFEQAAQQIVFVMNGNLAQQKGHKKEADTPITAESWHISEI